MSLHKSSSSVIRFVALGLVLLIADFGRADQTYDVVVYGGTPAGVTAAVAAAREKISVVLIEPSHHIGGMTTGGLSSTDVGKPDAIGGLALEFFERAARLYNDPAKLAGRGKFYSEPHVAEQAFNDMLKEAGVTVVLGERLELTEGVKKQGQRIVSVTTEAGKTFAGKVFIDASYEGDVMARAGVKNVVGRESRQTYGEPLAGYFPMPIRPRSADVMGSECPCVGGTGPHYIHGTPTTLSALDASGHPIFGVEEAPKGANPGDADGRTQCYNFRIIVTRDKQNRVPFPKPVNYDPSHFELLLRLVRAYPNVRFSRLFHLGPIPNGKFDLNAAGLFSTDYPGHNTPYPDGDYATRRRIIQDHADYNQGLLWFLCHDDRLPQSLRDEANEWGLSKDEFTDNGNWPYQLYVREARRMIGEYVLTQKDEQKEITKPDSVAMGSFVIDCHIVRRIALPDGSLTDEGSFQDAPAKPYQVPYRSLVPRKEQCTNLLVPVCLSASHIAYCSIRMEPQYMMLGHAAGLAAADVSRTGSSVQDVNIAGLQGKLHEQKAVLSLPAPPADVNSSALPGIVADDEQAKLSGDWVVSNFAAGIDGSYRHDGNEGKGKKSARFDLQVPTDGNYEVRFAYVANPNRASRVMVTVEHADGKSEVTVNERITPPIEKHFISLGTYHFTPAKTAVITIGNRETDGYVVVDAVQLLATK